MFGFFDIATGSLNSSRMLEYVNTDAQFDEKTNKSVAAIIHHHAKRTAYEQYSGVFLSLEYYLSKMEDLHRVSLELEVKSKLYTIKYTLNNLQNGLFVWFPILVDQLYKGDEFTHVPSDVLVKLLSQNISNHASSNFNLSELTASVDKLDRKEVGYDFLAKKIVQNLGFDDVMIWSCSPLDNHLKLVGSSDIDDEFVISLNRYEGAIGNAIKSRKSLIVPDISSKKNTNLPKFQHPKTVKHRHWKAMILAPLFSHGSLVGAIGFYKREFMYLRRAEVVVVLYILSSLSKRLMRELIQNDDKDERLFQRMTKLAPQIFMGLKTEIHLHSMKNVVNRHARQIQGFMDLIWREDSEKLFSADKKNEVKELYDSKVLMVNDITACLQVARGSKKDSLQQKNISFISKMFRETITEWSLPASINTEVKEEIDKRGVIKCDPIALEHAFRNIVENAEYFLSNRNLMGEQPSLKVSIVQSMEILKIVVQDNAGGVVEEETSKVFSPFYSGAEKDGTGLGLWMTERIVKDHGGDVDLECDDKGCIVTITLPVRVK